MKALAHINILGLDEDPHVASADFPPSQYQAIFQYFRVATISCSKFSLRRGSGIRLSEGCNSWDDPHWNTEPVRQTGKDKNHSRSAHVTPPKDSLSYTRMHIPIMCARR
jgi:hypothetical protein